MVFLCKEVVTRLLLPPLLHHVLGQYLAFGDALTPEGKQAISDLDKEFIARNISPGGCADSLTVTIALYRLECLWKG
jgi:triphosphoribosyl-dephospho-CoA synthetase